MWVVAAVADGVAAVSALPWPARAVATQGAAHGKYSNAVHVRDQQHSLSACVVCVASTSGMQYCVV